MSIQEFFLSLSILAVSIVLGEVTVLAHAFGVVELVGVLACPGLLGFADPMPADHASLVTSAAVAGDWHFLNVIIFLIIVALIAFFKRLIILTGVRLLRLLRMTLFRLRWQLRLLNLFGHGLMNLNLLYGIALKLRDLASTHSELENFLIYRDLLLIQQFQEILFLLFLEGEHDSAQIGCLRTGLLLDDRVSCLAHCLDV